MITRPGGGGGHVGLLACSATPSRLPDAAAATSRPRPLRPLSPASTSMPAFSSRLRLLADARSPPEAPAAAAASSPSSSSPGCERVHREDCVVMAGGCITMMATHMRACPVPIESHRRCTVTNPRGACRTTCACTSQPQPTFCRLLALLRLLLWVALHQLHLQAVPNTHVLAAGSIPNTAVAAGQAAADAELVQQSLVAAAARLSRHIHSC